LVAQLQQAGRIADGRLGDTFVLDSVAALINDRTVDGIVVVTPPLGLPDRLHLDLGHRISRAFDLPTSHVVVPDTTWSGGLDLSIGAGSAVTRRA
jgi:hypothetical protein